MLARCRLTLLGCFTGLGLTIVSAGMSQTDVPDQRGDAKSFPAVENPFRQPARSTEVPADRAAATSSQPVANPTALPAESPILAQPVPSASTDTVAAPALTAEHIARQVQMVTQSADLDEAGRADLLKRLQEATRALQESEEATAKAAQYAVEIRQAPQLLLTAKAELGQPVIEPCIELPAEAQLVQVEQQLKQAEAKRVEYAAELAQRDAELKRRPERHAELRKQISEMTKRLADLEKQTAAPPPTGLKPIAVQVRQMELEAEQLVKTRQMEQLKLESQRIDALAELLPLQRDLAKRKVVHAEKEVTAWQKIAADVRKSESKRQAEEARRQVENAHPALKQLAERNAELAEKRKTIAAGIERVATESQQVNKHLSHLDADFKKLQEKVQIAGLSKTIGIILRKQRTDLHSSVSPEMCIRYVENELPAAQLTLIELEEERSQLGDVEQSVQDVVAELESVVPQADRYMVEHTASTLLATKRELLDTSIYDYNAFLKQLADLELNSRRLISETAAYSEFVDKHVLWIRSAEPFHVGDIRKVGQNLAMLADANLWLQIGEKTFAGLVRRPVQGVVALALVLTLAVMRRRMFNRLELLCNADSGNNLLNFLTTLEAMLLVILSSSVWPCLMWCGGWWLESSYDASEFSNAMAHGLQRGAAFFWLFQLVRGSIRSGGLGERHFGWPASATRVVRDNLFWLAALGIPISVTVTVIDRWDDGQGNDALGRLAFIMGMALTAAVMHNVFRRQKGMLQEPLARTPTGWLNRVRIASHLGGTGVPCVLAVFAAAGYYYSARQLAIRFELTMLIGLGLVLVHGVVTRWFLVKRRNIAIRQARERRNNQAEQPSDNKSPQPQIVAQDLTKIQSQLQYLLRYGAVLAVLVLTWYVWADVLPALRMLDRVVLWSSRMPVLETTADVNGELQAEMVERDVPTTLTHCLLAILLTVGTYVLGKNLPALLEITILERLPIDYGGRHALAIIFRYLVFLAGLVLICRTLSVSWTSVQWLAAAMTVGLGFGLQEIFANLVSGLIILFERPIRVGDIVTVNGVTGTVSRMQIRATTITDFDRREMIVPNKKFITEDVINWTLSDPVSRVTVNVGVAYGSDTARTHSILMKVANEHPLVMKDPPPSALFRCFGDSTLDFSLHVFIATRSVYGAVVHDLHTLIDQEFRAAGIEMSFPQRDVNIRSIDSSIFPVVAGMTKSKAA